MPAGVGRDEHVDTWAVLVQLVLLLGLQVEEIVHNVMAAEQLGLNAGHYCNRRAAHACALDVHSVQPTADAVTRLPRKAARVPRKAARVQIRRPSQSPALALDSDGARRARRLVIPRVALRDADASGSE